MRAYILIKISVKDMRSLLSEVRGLDSVEDADLLFGEYDIIARASVTNDQQLLRLIENISQIEGALDTHTLVVAPFA